jgi:hypothetical protein
MKARSLWPSASVALSELRELAEVGAEDGVGGVFQLEDLAERLGRAVEEFFIHVVLSA